MRTALAACLCALVPAAAVAAQQLQPSRYDVRPALAILPFDLAAIGAPAPAAAGSAPPPPPPRPRPQPGGASMPPVFAPPRRPRLPIPVPRPSFPLAASLAARPVAGGNADSPATAPTMATPDGAGGVGVGIADLLAERLLAVGLFRLVERRELGALDGERRLGQSGTDSAEAATLRRARLMGARYLIAGSVVQFGTDASHVAAGGGLRGVFGGFIFRRRLTRVALLARVVDVETGEIIAVVRGIGDSRKGGSLTLGGLGGGAGGIATVGSDAWRNSALGEATERAVAQLGERLGEQRAIMH